MRYTAFLRWLLFVGLLLVGTYFTAEYHVLDNIWHQDFTKISVMIGAVFLYATFKAGISSVKLINYDEDDRAWGYEYHESVKDNNEFLASMCSGLGMFGTVVGMIAMMAAIGELNLEHIDLKDFALSMSTALYTTGVGLFANILIRAQNHSNWTAMETICAKIEDYRTLMKAHAHEPVLSGDLD